MAGCASSGALEISLAGLYVSSLQIFRIDAFAAARAPVSARAIQGVVLLGMDECRQAGNIRIGLVERRHAFVGAATAHHDSDLVSIHILRDQLRTRKVRAALSAARFAAVTKGTILSKHC